MKRKVKKIMGIALTIIFSSTLCINTTYAMNNSDVVNNFQCQQQENDNSSNELIIPNQMEIPEDKANDIQGYIVSEIERINNVNIISVNSSVVQIGSSATVDITVISEDNRKGSAKINVTIKSSDKDNGTLNIPSDIKVLSEEEDNIDKVIIKRIEEMNNVVITSSSSSIIKRGNNATVTLTVVSSDGRSAKGVVNVLIVHKPVINAENKKIEVGMEFHPLKDVKAIDEEDGDITINIKVKQCTVNTDVVGNYIVVYEVTDEDGYKTTKEISVEVVKPEKQYTNIRLGGLNRFETAIQIAREYSTDKLDCIVLASGNDFPDALSGSVLAYKNNAPILLVDMYDNSELLSYVEHNLKSSGKIYILGGTRVVPESIVNSLASKGFKNVERLGGADRYATNLDIVNELNVSKGTDVVIADSLVFADSLSVSSIAAKKGMPIFIANNELDSDTLNKIKSIQPQNIYIVGGTQAVSSVIGDQLKQISKVTRVAGINRYETSLEIARYFNMDTSTVAIASGCEFPDALTGSVLASKYNSPILLVEEDVVNQKEYLDSTKINKIYVLGGTAAVSKEIVDKLKK